MNMRNAKAVTPGGKPAMPMKAMPMKGAKGKSATMMGLGSKGKGKGLTKRAGK